MCVSEAVCLLGGDWELGVVGRQGRGEEVRVKEGLGRREGDARTHTHTLYRRLNSHLQQTCVS